MKEQITKLKISTTFLTLLFGLALLAFSCQQADRESASAQNEALAMEYVEAYNAQNRSALKTVLADPIMVSGEEESVDSFLDFIEMYWNLFPDMTLEPTHVVGADEHVTMRVDINGTGSGEFMGYDIDGKEVNISETYLIEVSDGQFAELWYNWDELGFWTQLGVVESPYPEE